MVNKSKKNNLRRIVISVCLLCASFILLVGTAIAWFIVGGNASAGVDDISVGTFEIESLECSFYRGDGFRHDLKTGNTYDNGGNLQEMNFSMLEYDTIITEKNWNNNLILKADITFAADIKSDALTADIAASGLIFGESASGMYNLSDVLRIGMLTDIDLTGAAANSEIYTAATAAFTGVADGDKKRFVMLSGAADPVKNASCNFTCPIPAGEGNKLCLYFNLEYDEPLVKKLYGAGYGEFDSAGKDKLILRSDLKFAFDTAEGGNA